MKTCARCNNTKPDSEFHRANRERSRLTSYCKPCGREASKEWRLANVERCNARRRARYAAKTPEQRAEARRKVRAVHGDKIRAAKRAAYARDREPVLEQQRAYRAANRDEIRARQKARNSTAEAKAAQKARSRKWYERNQERAQQLANEWNKAHPESRRERVRRRRARLRGATVERVDYAVVLERDGLHCYLCDTGIRGPIDFDHIVPIARGGEHSYANIAVTHARCNRRKRDLLVHELPWAAPSARDTNAQAISDALSAA